MSIGFSSLIRYDYFLHYCYFIDDNDGSEVRYNADKLFKHIIKPVCENCDFNAIRVDQLNDANSITQTIIDHLESAALVIADITGHNPNVFYEMGYRARNKKPIIHLKAKDETLPFDISSIRTYDYDLTDLDNVEEVKERLEQTIRSMSFPSTNEPQNDGDIKQESPITSTLPILYQIIDEITDLKNEVKSNNNDIIQTVIKAMQNSQPPITTEAALQSQLLGAFIQNPESLMRLAEIADKLPTRQNGNKPALNRK